MTRRLSPARGSARLGNKRVAITFDAEMFDRIRQIAEEIGISFGEEVRILVRMALEATE
jgi:hypothetical protein